MKVVAIINPMAGASRQRAGLRALITRLQSSGIELEPHVTAGPGQAQRMAARIARHAQPDKPPRAVLVAGGDGTVCEVANGLTGSTVPLVVWPTGTENLFARSLGFRPDPDLILNCLSAGRVLSMDVGVVNGRSILVVAGVGFDAEVVHRLTPTRRGYITHLTYFGPLWRTFWEHRFPLIRVVGDDQLLWEGRGMVFVGNLPRYSLGLRVVRDAQLDDGLLDVCAFTCRGRRQLLAHSLRTVLRRHLEHGGVWYARLTRIRVESPAPVPVELDGEQAGWLPIEVTVRPAAIRVQLPPPRPILAPTNVQH